jgi:hypothetical protein
MKKLYWFGERKIHSATLLSSTGMVFLQRGSCGRGGGGGSLVHRKNIVLEDQTTNRIGDSDCAKETAII